MCRPLHDMPPYDAFLNCDGGSEGGGEAIGVIDVMIGGLVRTIERLEAEHVSRWSAGHTGE
jgi:hypothetical protein